MLLMPCDDTKMECEMSQKTEIHLIKNSNKYDKKAKNLTLFFFLKKKQFILYLLLSGIKLNALVHKNHMTHVD
jgi:hypothetical protein